MERNCQYCGDDAANIVTDTQHGECAYCDACKEQAPGWARFDIQVQG